MRVHVSASIVKALRRRLLAVAVVVALTLSAAAAGAGQIRTWEASSAQQLNGPMWEPLSPAGTATDLGTEYDPFVIGWRIQPAVSQHQIEQAAGGRSLGIVEASETLRLEPVTA